MKTLALLWIAALAAQSEPVRQPPKRISPGDHGIGRQVPDLEVAGLDDKKHKLSQLAPKKPLVIALTSTSCPISKKYAPALARLEDAWRAKGVAFLYVDPIAADSADDLKALAKQLGLEAPVVRDPEGAVARALGAITTTDAFLLDASRTLVYRGAVDDQYGLGYSLDQPKKTWLVAALEAVVAGRTPEVAATWAPGCALDLSKAKAPAEPVTYHNRISRVVQNACLECHRKGGVAPFSLETPKDVAAHKGMIKKVVEQGTMPPWFAAPPAAGAASPWANDRSLAKREKEDLLGWLAAGLPEGNAADAPRARKFPETWQIGKPDAVFQLPRAVPVKAEGTMGYVDLSVETDLPEDRWVSAIEIRPTAPEVVHHVLVFVQEKPDAKKKRKLFEDPLGYYAVYVPGQSAVVYPAGYGRPFPAGAKLKFQMHYTPNGKATQDQTQIGLVFSKEPPKHAVRTASIVNFLFRIPPGAENHMEKARIPVPKEVQVLSFFPHMHLRGKSFKYEVALPGGERETLLEVPRYDFNWQFSYQYAERRTIPPGSSIEVTGWFDNSKNNPANPDPTKAVRWGVQTHEEMLIGFVEYVIPSESPAGN